MKNKKLIKIFSIFALVVAFAGCSKNKPTPVKENSVSTQQPVSVESNEQSLMEKDMSTQSSDPKSSAVKDLNTIDGLNEEDGVYVTTFMASNGGKALENSSIATTNGVSISDGQLRIKGTMNYRKESADIDNQKLLDKEEHVFKLSENVEYAAVGGTAPKKVMTQEEFLKMAKEVEESGLALIIGVEKGLVITVAISS